MTPYNVPPPPTGNIAGLIIVGSIIACMIFLSCWPSITKWYNEFRYRHHTIRSFIICQKSPDIDLKKLYRVVDDTNDFLRGKTLKGIRLDRRKIKTKNLISITSVPGDGCYYFMVWYKGKGQ